jgi:hypothetical protein
MKKIAPIYRGRLRISINEFTTPKALAPGIA